MKRKFLSVLLILAVTVSLALPTYAAETKGELEDELSDVKDEKEQVSNQLAETKDRIDELNEKVSVLNGEIAEANSKISQTEAEIQQKQKDMQEREDGLNERLRVMYKNGSIGYVDVLLGSNSISEFLSNLDMIQRIYRNDMEV
ncbi:MAG: coiled-coil domain-containing protein [Anaerovoracaceae bacterium]